jgi:hypothetical protein
MPSFADANLVENIYSKKLVFNDSTLRQRQLRKALAVAGQGQRPLQKALAVAGADYAHQGTRV